MLLHYIKILLRKQPIFTAINFAGLVLGMAASLLLFRYVRYEQTYDLQSPHAGSIWRVYNQTLNGKTVVNQDANTHSAVGPTLKATVPSVVDYARLYCGNTPEATVVVGNQPFDIHRYYATDQGFLRMFPQKIVEGNAQNCLTAPHTVILTSTTAKRLFGNEQVVGKGLRLKDGRLAGTYTVTAVVADPPKNTHLKFDMLVSYASRYARGHEDNFESYWDYNYFQLAPDASTDGVTKKLAEINQTFLKKEGIQLVIQPFKDIHLHSNLTYELEPNGSARTVQFLGIIALVILVIAFVNYINLTTALANERGKEVGVRKVLGASRGTLTQQFLWESFVISSVAFGAAVVGVQLSTDWFGGIVGRDLSVSNTVDGVYWGVSIGFIVLIWFVAGLYPALQLSGFRPVEVLRGRFVAGNTETLRKSLVVVQFACSAGLIFGVLVIEKQLHFLNNHELGVQLDQLVSVKVPASEDNRDSTIFRKLALFKSECAKVVGIEGASSSNIVPGLGINTIAGSNRPLHWVKKPDFAKITSYFVETDQDFFPLFGIRLLAGKHQFFPDRVARFNTITINETMRKALGFPSPEAAIGQQIAYENSENNSSMTVGAVVEDFHIESLKSAPKPTFYYCFAPQELGYLTLKMNVRQLEASLGSMQLAWKKIYPEEPFRYWFLDENFAHQYQNERQFNRVFGIFAVFAIAISCLGILGLTAYNVQRRRKEIGIRKVLGASVLSITVMLSTNFLKLIAFAVVLATPVAYYLMRQWLQEFAYQTEISWWVIAATAVGVLAVALLTVSVQSVKAALMNPVKSLKSE